MSRTSNSEIAANAISANGLTPDSTAGSFIRAVETLAPHLDHKTVIRIAAKAVEIVCRTV